MAWNQLSSTRIYPGQTLRVETSTMSSSGSAPQQPRESVVHRVRKGESLWEIASNYNTSVDALRRTNSHLGRTLHIGDRVVIPAAR
jgi:LysM repeat protein